MSHKLKIDNLLTKFIKELKTHAVSYFLAPNTLQEHF